MSWAALPGPGEAALIAAGISAAHGRLDLAAVVAVAWAGATVGGSSGWLAGVKGGRGLITAPGPLYTLRLALIARGDRFCELYGPIAVLFTPSWMAGIHDMRWSRSCSPTPLGAHLGFGDRGWRLPHPPIADIAADVGLAGAIVVGVLFVAALLFVRRRSLR